MFPMPGISLIKLRLSSIVAAPVPLGLDIATEKLSYDAPCRLCSVVQWDRAQPRAVYAAQLLWGDLRRITPTANPSRYGVRTQGFSADQPPMPLSRITVVHGQKTWSCGVARMSLPPITGIEILSLLCTNGVNFWPNRGFSSTGWGEV